MNILMVSSLFYPTIGGVTTYIENLILSLKAKNLNVKLICPIYIEDYNLLNNENFKFDNYDVKFFIINEKKENSKNILTGLLRKYSYNKSCHQIYEYILSNYTNENTIIHQHDLISNFKLIKKLKKNGYKIVLTNHTGETLLWNKIPFFGKKMIDYQFKFYNFIIGPSRELAFISKKYKNKSEYFPNSIKILNKKLLLQEKNNKLVYFCPRRWAPTKGIIYYLKALKKLKETNREIFENCIFLFAGNGYSDYEEYKNQCQKIIEEIKSNNIILLGDIKDPEEMKKLYYKSDFTVIPSLYEAISLSALEAILEGSILISTDVGGMPELISNNQTGFLCKPQSEDEILKLIKKTYGLKDVEKRDIKEKSFENVYENFNYEKLIDRHISLYKKLLLNNK